MMIRKLLQYIVLCLVAPALCFGCAWPVKEDNKTNEMNMMRRQADEEKAKTFWKTDEVRPQYLALARDLIGRRFYEVALVQLDKAAEESPNEPEVFHLKGVCHRELKDYKTAETSFKRALALDPDFAPAHDGLAMTYELMGEKERAWDYFTKAIKLNPARPDYYNNLGFSKMRVGDLEEAERWFRKSIALEPGFKTAVNNLAICLGLAGRDQEALALLRKSATPAAACNNMGVIHLIKGEREKALAMFGRAVAMDPNFKEAARNMATLQGREDHRRQPD